MTDPIEVIARARLKQRGVSPEEFIGIPKSSYPVVTALEHEMKKANSVIAALNAAGLVVVSKDECTCAIQMVHTNLHCPVHGQAMIKEAGK